MFLSDNSESLYILCTFVKRKKKDLAIDFVNDINNMQKNKITKSELAAWDEYMCKSKILVIGDVMLDVYIHGYVNRISPEAPVPIVNVSGRKTCLGGAANVAFNLQAMGAMPILCGIIGDDIKGNEFLSLLEENKLPTYGMMEIENRPTTVKSRIIGNKMQLLRIDEEVDTPLSDEENQHFCSHIQKILLEQDIQAVIFEDYDKGAISPALIHTVTTIAQVKSIPVLVDPKKRNFMHYKSISLFKPNLTELINGLQLDKGLDMLSLSKEINKFMNNNQLEIVMTTLSDKGIVICYNNKTSFEYDWIPAHVRSIADVSGAGDTVISIATLALIYGFSPSRIAELSNIAGGLVCETMGVVPVDKRIFFMECLKIME